MGISDAIAEASGLYGAREHANAGGGKRGRDGALAVLFVVQVRTSQRMHGESNPRPSGRRRPVCPQGFLGCLVYRGTLLE